MQPLIQFSVLAYGSTNKTKIDILISKLKRFATVILKIREYQSVTKLRVKNKMRSANELQLYE